MEKRKSLLLQNRARSVAEEEARRLQLEQWECKFCFHSNKCIQYANTWQEPKEICRLCSESNGGEPSVFEVPQQLYSTYSVLITIWNSMIRKMTENKREYTCDPLNIYSCPIIHKLKFIMVCYHYYLQQQSVEELFEVLRENLSDDDAALSIVPGHLLDNIHSMHWLIMILPNVDVSAVANWYQHVVDVHRNEDDNTLFDSFEKNENDETLFSCDHKECEYVARDLDRRRGRRRYCNDADSDFDSDDDEGLPFTQLRTSRMDEDSLPELQELYALEDTALFFLQAAHAFLYHSRFRARQERDWKDDDEDDNDEEKKGDENGGRELGLKNRWQSYEFGSHIRYDIRYPKFDSFKEEMMKNEMYCISEGTWTWKLNQAKILWQTEIVQSKENSRYLAKKSDSKYAVDEDDPLGVENIVAVLLYCDLDNLQKKFNESFRKRMESDTEKDIQIRHCENFYWFGR